MTIGERHIFITLTSVPNIIKGNLKSFIITFSSKCHKRDTKKLLFMQEAYVYRVFSRDIWKGGNIGVRAGGRGVLGVYYLLENIIHYYCQSEVGASHPL